MDTFEFIVTIIGVLSWPLCVLIVVLILRHEAKKYMKYEEDDEI